MLTTNVLTTSYFLQQFEVKGNTFEVSVRATLMQQRKSIAFFSQTLTMCNIGRLVYK